MGIYLLVGGALVLSVLIVYCLQGFSSSLHREIDQTHLFLNILEVSDRT